MNAEIAKELKRLRETWRKESTQRRLDMLREVKVKKRHHQKTETAEGLSIFQSNNFGKFSYIILSRAS